VWGANGRGDSSWGCGFRVSAFGLGEAWCGAAGRAGRVSCPYECGLRGDGRPGVLPYERGLRGDGRPGVLPYERGSGGRGTLGAVGRRGDRLGPCLASGVAGRLLWAQVISAPLTRHIGGNGRLQDSCRPSSGSG
jgi:hypothetical protein